MDHLVPPGAGPGWQPDLCPRWRGKQQDPDPAGVYRRFQVAPAGCGPHPPQHPPAQKTTNITCKWSERGEGSTSSAEEPLSSRNTLAHSLYANSFRSKWQHASKANLTGYSGDSLTSSSGVRAFPQSGFPTEDFSPARLLFVSAAILNSHKKRTHIWRSKCPSQRVQSDQTHLHLVLAEIGPNREASLGRGVANLSTSRPAVSLTNAREMSALMGEPARVSRRTTALFTLAAQYANDSASGRRRRGGIGPRWGAPARPRRHREQESAAGAGFPDEAERICEPVRPYQRQQGTRARRRLR